MSKAKNKQNTVSIIITVVAALLAIAAVVFLIITISSEQDEIVEQPGVSGTPDFINDQLIGNMEQAAYDLLPENYKIYQYLTRGMNIKPEPYGNYPEDGFYTCDNSDYPTFEAFSEYVRSVYTADTAEKLLTDPFGGGPVFGDDDGELGLSVDFKATEDAGLSWTDAKFVCSPVSEAECKVQITLKDESGKDVIKNVTMVLENGSWKLTELVG